MNAPDRDMPNNERDEMEIRTWWCRPYVVGQDDRWSVRVLDGGAWDRSTWHADFPTQSAAVDFAEKLHRIYWENLSCNELPVPFPYQTLMLPLPGIPGAMSSQLVGPAVLVAELKERLRET